MIYLDTAEEVLLTIKGLSGLTFTVRPLSCRQWIERKNLKVQMEAAMDEAAANEILNKIILMHLVRVNGDGGKVLTDGEMAALLDDRMTPAGKWRLLEEAVMATELVPEEKKSTTSEADSAPSNASSAEELANA